MTGKNDYGMAGKGWRETGGRNIWRESVGGENIEGKGLRKNISRRVERDSMAGYIGGKNCS